MASKFSVIANGHIFSSLYLEYSWTFSVFSPAYDLQYKYNAKIDSINQVG